MVALHPTTRGALERYLVARRRESTPLGHLFVLATGRPPSRRAATKTFRKLAGSKQDCATAQWRADRLRIRCAMPLPFAPLRTLLATPTPAVTCWRSPPISVHCEIAHTYWYLEATPVLLRGIAEATERTHRGGTSDD